MRQQPAFSGTGDNGVIGDSTNIGGDPLLNFDSRVRSLSYNGSVLVCPLPVVRHSVVLLQKMVTSTRWHSSLIVSRSLLRLAPSRQSTPLNSLRISRQFTVLTQRLNSLTFSALKFFLRLTAKSFVTSTRPLNSAHSNQTSSPQGCW